MIQCEATLALFLYTRRNFSPRKKFHAQKIFEHALAIEKYFYFCGKKIFRVSKNFRAREILRGIFINEFNMKISFKFWAHTCTTSKNFRV